MSPPVTFSQWLGGALGRALLPPRCLVCEAPGAGDRDLCADCLLALPWNGPACPRCGLPLAAAGPCDGSPPLPGMTASARGPLPSTLGRQAGAACGRCLRRPPPLDATVAALAYRFPIDRLLPRFKFHGDLAAGRLLAGLMAEAWADRFTAGPAVAGTHAAAFAHGRRAVPAARVEVLVPVPLHPARLRQRGYDQALELARPLSRALRLPLCADGLRRVRATQAQTTLDAADRRRNVRGAFLARAGPWPASVALLDDVMTTGATLAECARALRQAGVAHVEAWVLARAPPPGRGDQPSA